MKSLLPFSLSLYLSPFIIAYLDTINKSIQFFFLWVFLGIARSYLKIIGERQLARSRTQRRKTIRGLITLRCDKNSTRREGYPFGRDFVFRTKRRIVPRNSIEIIIYCCSHEFQLVVLAESSDGLRECQQENTTYRVTRVRI